MVTYWNKTIFIKLKILIILNKRKHVLVVFNELLKDQNESLKDQNESLKDQNKSLKDQNKSLISEPKG